ncbi:unnamed protein product [Peniophora sp. CBMAI 1063]|nr:unnamed protein product [Peniophora sp. CBMAI 1063]
MAAQYTAFARSGSSGRSSSSLSEQPDALVVQRSFRSGTKGTGYSAYESLRSELGVEWLSRRWTSATFDIDRHSGGRLLRSHLSAELDGGPLRHECKVTIDAEEVVAFDGSIPRLLASLPMSTLTRLDLHISDDIVQSWGEDAICSAFGDARSVTNLILTGRSLCACACMLLGLEEDRALPTIPKAFPSLTTLTLDEINLGDIMDPISPPSRVPALWQEQKSSGETVRDILAHALLLRKRSPGLLVQIGGSHIQKQDLTLLKSTLRTLAGDVLPIKVKHYVKDAHSEGCRHFGQRDTSGPTDNSDHRYNADYHDSDSEDSGF